MKKILIAFVLIVVTDLTHAQGPQPSKEETVKFLNTISQAGIGTLRPTVVKEHVISSVDVTYNKVEIHDSKGCFELWKNIPWQEFDSIRVEKDRIVVLFKIGMYCEEACPPIEYRTTDAIVGAYDRPDPKKYFFLYNIPSDKHESCKKAILRLAEIAKEENKDPFAN